jgi:hypothetical protein
MSEKPETRLATTVAVDVSRVEPSFRPPPLAAVSPSCVEPRRIEERWVEETD